jgi:hypothetical protein
VRLHELQVDRHRVRAFLRRHLYLAMRFDREG